MNQIEASVELVLVIGLIHVNTELIKCFVMLFLSKMSELMDDDHLQERLWASLKERGDPKLVLRFELPTLWARDEGVGAERVLNKVKSTIKAHLAERGT